MSWARVGVEKCRRLSKRSDKLLTSAEEDRGTIGLNDFKTWDRRNPGTGCDASTQITLSPAFRALAASCIPRAVLPTPGGPYTSVTFPLETPPYTGSISKELHSLFCRKASRRGRPVEMHRVVDALRSCSACAAETVGIRCGDEDEKLEIPGPWIEL